MKRNEHIVALSRDHHFGLLFCWKIRRGLNRGVDLKRMKSYLRFFWETDLKPHFEAEERFLFTNTNDELTSIAITEHGLISNLVTSIITDEKESAIGYAALATMIDNHIRFEERRLFPHLEKLLTAGELVQIGKQLQEAHATTHADTYEDAFWIYK